MAIHDLRPVLMLAVGLAYIGIAGQVIVRRQVAASDSRPLILYAAAGATCAALDSARYLGWLASWPVDFLAHLSLYEALSLSVIFLHLTWAFLRVSRRASPLYWLGAAWLAPALVVDTNILHLPGVLVAWSGWFVGRTALTQAALTLGWGVFAARAALLTGRTYRHTKQPLHRNRLAYWSIAIALGVAAMAVFLVRQDVAGNVMLLGAGLVATLGIVTHQLPDVRHALRQAMALVAIWSLAISAYAGAIVLAPDAQRLLPGLTGTGVAIVTAVIMVAAANPLLRLVERRVRRWASGLGYDARQMVGEYGG